MIEDVDKHVLRKYDIVQKLGKGVSPAFPGVRTPQHAPAAQRLLRGCGFPGVRTPQPGHSCPEPAPRSWL